MIGLYSSLSKGGAAARSARLDLDTSTIGRDCVDARTKTCFQSKSEELSSKRFTKITNEITVECECQSKRPVALSKRVPGLYQRS